MCSEDMQVLELSIAVASAAELSDLQGLTGAKLARVPDATFVMGRAGILINF